MRIGCVGFATERGLGRLVKDFVAHGVVTDVLVVEHSTIPTQDWYPDAPRIKAREVNHYHPQLQEFCRGKDAMLFFETPHDWTLIDFCKSIGVRTYLVTMMECTPLNHPVPHKYLCPSLLDVQEFAKYNHAFLPLPVEVPWRLRERAEHFIHNGGYLGIRGREGTCTLIEAMRHVKARIRLTIRVQENVDKEHQLMAAMDPRIEYLAGTVPWESLYAEGDVAVGAQKWNGCSLPLQEAFASGLLVMNTDRFPMNTWLPKSPLVPVAQTIPGSSIGRAYRKFEESVVDPRTLAETIDAWHGRDIAEFSRMGQDWALRNSWEVLKPRWMKELSS